MRNAYKYRKVPYEALTIYVMEGRDAVWDWRPCRTIEGNLIAWPTKKEALAWIKAQTTPKHIGRKMLVKAEQRYRIRAVSLSPSKAAGTLVK